jgi:hypothetical protein
MIALPEPLKRVSATLQHVVGDFCKTGGRRHSGHLLICFFTYYSARPSC